MTPSWTVPGRMPLRCHGEFHFFHRVSIFLFCHLHTLELFNSGNFFLGMVESLFERYQALSKNGLQATISTTLESRESLKCYHETTDYDFWERKSETNETSFPNLAIVRYSAGPRKNQQHANPLSGYDDVRTKWKWKNETTKTCWMLSSTGITLPLRVYILSYSLLYLFPAHT